MNVPKELLYSKEHEWIRLEDNEGTVGITDYAQQQLGDVVFVELPSAGQSMEANATFGTVESVKAVSEVYLPVSGAVADVNEELMDAPELINDDPYGSGWMVKIRLSQPDELSELLSAEDYRRYVEEELEGD